MENHRSQRIARFPNEAGHVLIINPGSSSVKLDLFQRVRRGYDALQSVHCGNNDDENGILREFGDITPGHVLIRFVHGGPHLYQPVVIDGDVAGTLSGLAALAPLHTEHSLRWLHRAQARWREATRYIAVFDTGFFHDLPVVAQRYALPRQLQLDHHIRRYGFHGLAHAAMMRNWHEWHPGARDARLVTLQLGSGCSAAAIHGARAIDTSMGFTPNEGLIMSTRSGDLDPGLLTWLQRTMQWDSEYTDAVLNKSSGLLGLSAESADMGALLASDTAAAREAVDCFCYRVKKTVGAYIAALGGIDGLVFGGGIGENAAAVRAQIIDGLAVFGLRLDAGRNMRGGNATRAISPAGATPDIWIVRGDESREMIQQAEQAGLLASG